MNTSTQNLSDEPTLANGPPWYQSTDALHTSMHNLADELTLANGPPCTRVEMPCIPVPKTCQMNLLWPMDPLYQTRDAMNTSTHNVADEATLANGPLQYQSTDALNTSTHNLADEPTLANRPLQYQSRDALNISTHNLADEATLANGPPCTRLEMP